ncbi:MAG: site-2 protease family protein [Desulfurococcales archaeon]|nr:site-2 protease family protein [Desulfurococcales archaeon]
MYRELENTGCHVFARFEDKKGIVIRIISSKESKSRNLLAAVMALATIASVYYSGIGLSEVSTMLGKSGLQWKPEGYLIGLLVPLLIHEAGHWLAMAKYGVPRSLPYLLPAPPLQLGFLGTFGAVINLRWLPPSSEALSVMAIAGPLAGFLAAIPLALLGLQDSVVPVAELPPGTREINVVPVIMAVFLSMIDVGEGQAVLASPMTYATYVVFIVTFLNLLPVAMLDGGHLIRSVVSERTHSIISQATVLLLFMASFIVPLFFMFAILALFMLIITRGRHPGTSLGIERVTWKVVASVVTYFLLLILTIPIPVV